MRNPNLCDSPSLYSIAAFRTINIFIYIFMYKCPSPYFCPAAIYNTAGSNFVNVKNQGLKRPCIQLKCCRGILHFELLLGDEQITANKLRPFFLNRRLGELVDSPRQRFKKNGRFWQVQKVQFSSTTMEDGMLPNRLCRSLRVEMGNPLGPIIFY